MSNDDQIGSRRAPRQGMGGSPVGSGLTIALAAVALVAGFFILRDLNESGSSAGGVSTPARDDADVDANPVISVDLSTPVDTASVVTDPPRTITGATVIIANANSIGGSAGQMSASLEFEGYTMGDAVDATGANLEESIVYYAEGVAGAQAVAESVALDLGGVDVLTLPTPPPIAGGDVGDAGVVVMLGGVQAGQSISDLSVATESAGAGAAPDPSDGEAPPDDADAEAEPEPEE